MPKDYLEERLEEAKKLVDNLLTNKEFYTHDDAYKLLNSFSFAVEIEFSDIKSYLPSAVIMPDNIYEYTKGFIIDDNYKIYAINYGTGFIIIIISGTDFVTGYYGDTINDFTLRIYYCLEYMTRNYIY